MKKLQMLLMGLAIISLLAVACGKQYPAPMNPQIADTKVRSDALSKSSTAGPQLFGAAHSGPNGPSTLYTIDASTGTATAIGPIGFERCSAMDVDQSGTLYAICERSDGSNENVLITIDPLTGAGTEIGPTSVSMFQTTTTGMSFRPSDNTLFVPTFFPGAILATVDLTTGMGTRLAGDPQIGASPGNGCDCGWSFAFAPDNTLYLTVGNRLFTVDQVTGQATFVADTAPASDTDFRINGADFEPGTGILYGSLARGFSSNLNRLVIIDPTTGNVTVVGESTLGLDALAWLAGSVLDVSIDIKPGSDPNCFNNDGHGVIPVAILGDAEFDVRDIDPATMQLEGLDVRAAGKSNKLLAHYEDVNGDGFEDLVIQIEDSDGVFQNGEGTATLTGNLFDGTPIEGTDSICIVP